MISGPNYEVATLPETQFFALARNGSEVGKYLPIPEGVQCWNNATIGGIDVLATKAGDDLFIIADDTKLGLALFHYVHDTETDSGYKYSYTLPYRVITERRSKTMSNALSEYAARAGSARNMGMMQLGGQPLPEQVPVGDGISGGVNLRRLQRDAISRSYVVGYIMGAAPAITLAMSKKKQMEGDPVYNIVAKESKPSRPMFVLMALAARCVSKGGVLASPSEIMSGEVDFNTTDPQKMIYQYFKPWAAIGYISALGGRIPEYAPFVSDAKSQWSSEDILAGKPEVSFVRVHAAENKSRTGGGSQDKFKFSLKSTSDRRSLYTQNNHLCLRALEHMSVQCTSEEDAYNLNLSAFEGWKYRTVSTNATGAKDGFTKALTECPGQIWKKTYNINGEPVEGIGSAFFMAANEEKNEAGEMVMRHQLSYYPWWQTGALRPDHPSAVERIVHRTLRPAEGDKRARMVTHPILWKDNPNHPVFKGYDRFVNHILQAGYIREDKLKSLGGRVTRSRKQAQGLSADQMTSLKQFLRTEDVLADITAAQDEAADRSVLDERV